MSQSIKESILLDVRKKILNVETRGIAFKENEYSIIYIPSLEISAYGKNLKQAKKMLEIQLDEFSENLFKLPASTIHQEFKRLGWKPDKFFKRKLNIELSDTTFEDIRKQYNLPKDTPIKQIPIIA